MCSCQPFFPPPPTLPPVTVFDFFIFEMFEFLKSLSLLLSLFSTFQKSNISKIKKWYREESGGWTFGQLIREQPSPLAVQPGHTGLGCPYVHLAIPNVAKMKKKWKKKSVSKMKNQKRKETQKSKIQKIRQFQKWKKSKIQKRGIGHFAKKRGWGGGGG